ncbi:hypothetical protein RI367_002527 [Sorochytrium milnesiophthora]
MISQHSHSGQFCRHAVGKLADVVDAAKRKGFSHLAMTEHVPRRDASELYPEEVAAGDTSADLQTRFTAYLDEAARLAHAQRHDPVLKLVVGCESEYITLRDLDNHAHLCDASALVPSSALLTVGSVHHIHGIPLDFSPELYGRCLAASGNNIQQLYADYFDAQHTMFERLRPHVVGHFDLVRIFSRQHIHSSGDDFDVHVLHAPQVWSRIERNVALAIAAGCLFEINSRSWKKGLDGYPCRDIVRLIQRLGGRFTLSDDSHGPDDLGMHYERLQQYVRELGIDQVYCYEYQGDLESFDVAEWMRTRKLVLVAVSTEHAFHCR